MTTIIPQPIMAYCSTVRRCYETTDYQLQRVNSHVWAWAWCPFCDHHGRVHGAADYDATRPQPHLTEVQTK